MKIGFFTDSYRPYTSGVVRSIETFSSELQSVGHQVYIFAPQYKNYTKKEEGVFRFVSLPSPTNREYTLPIPISPKVRPTIKKLGLDVIHVHSPFLLGRLGARLAHQEKLPLVYTYHTLYDKYVHYLPFAQSFSKKVVQKIATDFCNTCNLVIVPTGVIGKVIRQAGVTAPVINIPTGINIKDYAQGDPLWLKRTYGIPSQDKVLLFVGRLGQEKNLDFLVQAFAQVQHQIPDLTLVLVGSGPQESVLKQTAAQMNMSDKIVFTGNLNPSSVINCYLGADLFVFASVTETQGLVIGEAKAGGLPVVAVDAFGVKEMVEHGESGFLTPLVLDEFSSRITSLLTNDQLYQYMSEQAR
ncbi:MAG TPA: glycosyltransferase family 4 protein, partial [Clostridia bacterium]|nr:glycosyltransferase family 4 protein [Clostridia bacterium]